MENQAKTLILKNGDKVEIVGWDETNKKPILKYTQRFGMQIAEYIDNLKG